MILDTTFLRLCIFRNLKTKVATKGILLKKSCSKKIHKFHLYWSLFLIELQAWMPATFLKRDFNTPTLQICKIFKETYFEEQLRAISSEKIPMKRKKLRNLFIGAFINVVFMITVYEAVQFLFIFISLYHFSPSLTYFKGHLFVIHSSFRSHICERFLTVKVHKKNWENACSS